MSEEFVPGIGGEFVELRTPNGGCVVGRLVPRDGCVIAVTVPSAEISNLSPGDRIELGSLPPLELLRLRGTVVKTDNSGQRSLVLLNACTGTFHWHPHFVERRSSVRVRPSPLSPVTATLKVDGIPMEGRVRDLSVYGVAVIIPNARVDAVIVPSSVDLVLRLPTSSQELSFAADALRGEQLGTGVVYSLRLDSRRSDHFAVQQRALQEYVLRRGAELITPLERPYPPPPGAPSAAG